MCAKTAKKRQEDRTTMISATKKFIAAQKYNVVMQGKAIKTKKCVSLIKNGEVVRHGCGKPSMMGAIKPDGSKVIWVCMNRFHPDESLRCKNWRNGQLPPVKTKTGAAKKSNPVSKTLAGVPNNV